MKVVTVQQLEADFDAIMEDVEINKAHYRIEHEEGDLMLVPFESYEVLHDIYTGWIKEPQNNPPLEGFDPMPLPVEYLDCQPGG